MAKADSEKASVLISDSSTVHDGPLESVRQFVVRGSVLSGLPDGDKRSIDNGIKILKAYFSHYASDGLEILRRADGTPMTEVPASAVLYEDDKLVIEYFGTIDAIMKNTASGHIMIADHKTTAALGKDFYNRIRPNHQYTGYIWLAQQALGIQTNLFMVNGIQVAKTKCEFARQVTDRNAEDIKEFKDVVVNAVEIYLRSLEKNIFPMYSPNPCSNYGGCTFLDICSSPANLRETIIKAKYTNPL